MKSNYSYQLDKQSGTEGMLAQNERIAADAARACLYAVVERFNTEDAFWGSFVPEMESTNFDDKRFCVRLEGRGVRLEVRGMILAMAETPPAFAPSVIVGATPPGSNATPDRWHPINCSVDAHGCFVTSNFRKAIEASIADVRRRF